MFVRRKSVILFLLPGFLLLFWFHILPFFSGIRYSITDGSVNMQFVGLRNYNALWQNEMFRLGLKNTVELSVLCAPLLWLLSLALALGLQSIHPEGKIFRSFVLLPYLAPSSAMLLVWLLLFDNGGPVNRLLTGMGMEKVLWLEGSALRLPIVLLFLWKNLGFCTIVFLAALQTVPEAYLEYARLEGAGFFTRTFRVMLPQIVPTAFLVFIFAWINAFKVFQEAYIIAGAYPSQSIYTLQHYMNNQFARMDFQMVTASAYSFAALVMVFFAVLFLLQKKAAEQGG